MANPLLDYLIEQGWARNDTELGKLLELSPAAVSKIRNGKPPSAFVILAIYDATDLSIEKIRELANAVRSV